MRAVLHVLIVLVPLVLGSCEDFYVEWPLDFIKQYNQRPKYITAECIISYVKLKNFEVAEYLILEGEDIDLAKLREQLVKIKQPMDKLLRKSQIAAKEVPVSPAFKWAQSKDFVFLDVKLAHRIDSPACNSIEDEKLEIEGSLVKFTGHCENSGQKLRIELNITLHAEIDASLSKYVKSTGHVSIDLKKQDAPSAWPRLLTSTRPVNMHVWWELADQYRSELEAIRNLEDS